MAGIFGFFDYTKPGKGVSKDEPKKEGLDLYFHIFLKRFWKLIPLNLIYIIASVPAIIIGFDNMGDYSSRPQYRRSEIDT